VGDAMTQTRQPDTTHAVPLAALTRVADWLWELPRSFRADMRVPARIYATREMLEDAVRDRSLAQLVNLATLPGIQRFALAMPDVHEGYGSPVGGVAVTAVDEDGIISPGMIGYDINCGRPAAAVHAARRGGPAAAGRPRHRDLPGGPIGGRAERPAQARRSGPRRDPARWRARHGSTGIWRGGGSRSPGVPGTARGGGPHGRVGHREAAGA
jgi:tRNA-splicing ligase RtcB (3'-phosphate/5'-hydroxy nucleic acid ligase)